ncbi:MAG: AmmeMemoRadiSam system protein B [Halobacteriota archaeon]
MREPAKAGSWYPSDPRALKALLQSFIERVPQRDFSAAIVPHAGYACSGSTAGKIYSMLPKADTYVIVGPNHSYPVVSVSDEPWLTPLGLVDVNTAIIEKLDIDVNNKANKEDNAIELQVPFLQCLFDDFTIVPITMGLQGPESITRVSDTLQRVAGEDFVLIASSDFTHYEPDHVARQKDHWVIEPILKLDTSEFLTRSRSTSICGFGPIAVAMEFAKFRGAEHGELINYSTSAETCGDSAAVVGYAGVIMAQ